jgi:predicted glutamine amidotransferase
MVLHDAPRSLAALSREHPDGWGIAVHADLKGWNLERNTLSACTDARFRELATSGKGETLVAHIRQKTVGPTSVENTHPFMRDGFVFAHNGTLRNLEAVDARISSVRRLQIQGETDSEKLFALFLTRLDAANLRACCLDATADTVLKDTVTELRAIENIGSFNFVLSTGRVTYAHRFGRTLYVLSRGETDPRLRVRTASETGASIETAWSARRRAVFIASEALTDEPWRAVQDGTLIRLDRASLPNLVMLTGDYESESVS